MLAQSTEEVKIDYGPANIALNEPFQVKLVLINSSLRRYSAFPDIEGFVKAGTSSESSTTNYNGRVRREIKLVQTYMPQKEGLFKLPAFTMEVNGKEVPGESIIITVGPPKQQQARRQPQRPRTLFDELFGEPDTPQNDDFQEIEDHAFLQVSTDKPEVWSGEGFTTTLAIYIPDNEIFLFDFHNLNNQLNGLVRKIKPENCWEEGFQLYDIRREPVVIDGRAYGKYKLYQARYYPLNNEDVKFPAIELDMVKYKISRRSDIFGRRNKQQSIKKFKSKPVTVRVKALPEHPLKDEVAVGDFQLSESLSPAEVETGSSFTFNFTVSGQGNIAAIRSPLLNANPNLEIKGPKEKSNTRKKGSTVVGSKSFSYTGIANEPGQYAMNEIFNWIYFNSRTARYDTLSPKASLTATGESLQDVTIASNDPGLFYSQIDRADNTLQSGKDSVWYRYFLNGMLVILTGATLFLAFSRIKR